MSFMKAEIAERKALLASGQPVAQDIFTTLVRANEDEDAKFKLTAEELVRPIP
jgi:hypothetical protein